MSSRFLDNFSFAKLIAPVTEAEFFAHYWEQKPLCVHRHDPRYYDDLLTLEDFDRANANAASDEVRTPEHKLADISSGATLLLRHLDNREPKLRLLCRMLEQQLGHRFSTNVYLTPAQGRGFFPHWD